MEKYCQYYLKKDHRLLSLARKSSVLLRNPYIFYVCYRDNNCLNFCAFRAKDAIGCEIDGDLYLVHSD